MKQTSAPRPTDAELAILRVLWEKGPTTVREVVETLNAKIGAPIAPSLSRPVGYTTALKLMQIMSDKGLVQRDDTNRSHVYRPTSVASEQPTQRRLVKDLADRAFGGSTSKLVMAALSSQKSTPAELAEIRKLLRG
jgi:predicted transcriptional regulator